MFNWLRKISNKLLTPKADELSELAADIEQVHEEFKGIEALVQAEAEELKKTMERDLYDPYQYAVVYWNSESEDGPKAVERKAKKKKSSKKKASKKKVTKKSASKSRYGSQKKVSSKKKTATKKGK